MRADDMPILVGVAQHTVHPRDLSVAQEPISLMEEVARLALADTEADSAREIDSVRVVNVISWSYDRAAHLLAEKLSLGPGERLYSTIGGNTPQWLINRTAQDLIAGRIKAALIVGAEAGYSVRLAARARQKLPWTARAGAAQTDTIVGDSRPGWGPLEAAYEATLPARVFPLFENALRAKLGLSLAEHRQRIAHLCARFAAVAKENPHAWFRDGKDAATIGTVTPENRMIAFPYPKFMNAIIAVDQAACVIMTTVGLARRIGVPRNKWIYLVGWADAQDTFNVSKRRDFTSSPPLGRAARSALQQARVTINEIDLIDLYSCFPVAPQIAAREIGFGLEGEPVATVTGGLPYFGGPGNNYAMHAVATLCERLRSGRGRLGFVWALGWYFAKHAVGIYALEPTAGPGPHEPAQPRREDAGADSCAVAEQAAGRAVIETYTVVHDREGNPKSGIVVGRLDDGRRFLANTPTERSILIGMESQEMVGTRGTVSYDVASGRNIFLPGGA